MPYFKLEKEISNIGKPIIQIRGGSKDKNILYLVDDDYDSDKSEISEDSEKIFKMEDSLNSDYYDSDYYDSDYSSMDTDNEEMLIEEIVNEIVNKNATNKRVRERNKDIDALIMAFKNKKDSFRDDRLNKLYNISKTKYDDVKKSEFKIKDGKMRILPSFDADHRNTLYIAGPSDSGKSTQVKAYADGYNRVYPNNTVWLFSKVVGDKSLEGIKNLKQIELNEELSQDPININELKNSLVIFDDIGKIRDKDVKKEIDFLLGEILQEGRHPNIECIATNHIIADHKNTKDLLNESSFITVFPHTNKMQIKYILKTYIGLEPKQIKEVLEKVKGSRWMSIYTRAPNYVVYEHGCFLL